METTSAAIRGASGLVLLAAIYALFKTALFPFVALFAFDAPGSESSWWAWLWAIGLVSAPMLAIVSGALALTSLFTASRRLLLIAVPLAVVPVTMAALLAQ